MIHLAREATGFALAAGFVVASAASAQPLGMAEGNGNPDLNRDGKVDVLDLIGLMNAIDRVDLDRDGVWDENDDCVGWFDACGVCNGPGPQFVEQVAIVPRRDSIWMESEDAWFVFQTGADTLFRPVCDNPGCTDPLALNYEPEANVPDLDACKFADNLGPCEGQSALLYEGEVYPLVAVGDRCWFAEDLRTAKFADGSSIPVSMNAAAWSQTGERALPGRSVLTLGAGPLERQAVLYNFYAVEDARGLCPTAWHVASQADWSALFAATGTPPRSKALKARSVAVEVSRHYQVQAAIAGSQREHTAWLPFWDGTDELGLKVLPVGLRDRFGFYDYVGHAVGFWSAEETGNSFARAQFIGEGNPEVGLLHLMKSYALSVRCVR